MKRIESGQLKFYDTNYFEFSENNYIDNNSVISVKRRNCPFWLKPDDLLLGIPTCELMKINNNKLNNNKYISEIKIKDITLGQEINKIYFTGSSNADEGIYRYIITTGASKYWSEMFCVKIKKINGNSFYNFSDSNGNNFVDSNGNNFGQPI